MLTISVTDMKGSQNVREVQSVWKVKGEHGNYLVQYWIKDCTIPNTVTEGDVYVMNDNGKTVAYYHLMPRGYTGV